MKYKKYNTKEMSDRQLWQAVLTPIEDEMSILLKKFLTECKKEFFNRKIQLEPICK